MNLEGAQREEMRLGRWKALALSPDLILDAKQASFYSFTLLLFTARWFPKAEHEARASMWVVYWGN